MKRLCALLVIFITLALTFVNCGYALFLYPSEENDKVDISVSGSNALFDEKNTDEYYRVYFFASPYYATGADINGETLTDPLEIAKNENNPYNSDEEYSLIGVNLNNNKKYANVRFANNNYHYISYKKNNVGVLNGVYGSLDLFSKKDYTGYIRENETLNIQEQTSTYISLTVKENISIEKLSGIVAGTEFRDSYGFGPEFIGWTYDKEKTCARTMYNGERYNTSNNMARGDSRGYGMNKEIGYEIGNFGCQGEIEQITSTTSLKAIDKTTKDGSLVGDKIIYLYPVFMAKNYNEDKSLNGVTTPVLKFRVNSDNSLGEDGMYRYEYNQAYEVDYSKNRYTKGFFQKSLNDEKNNVNYYINNLYIGSDTMQLDVCPTNGNGQWGSYWTTLIDAEKFSDIGLESGFYDINVTFVQLSERYDGSSYKNVINNLIQRYEDTNQYVKTYSSLNEEETGIVAMTLDRAVPDGAKKDAYFVIGFKKIEIFRLVGDEFGSITNYNTPGYKELQLTTQLGDSVQYIIGRIYLSSGSEISVLTEYADGTSHGNLPYTISGMENEKLDDIYNKFGIQFTSVGTSGSGTDIIIEDNVLKVKKSQSYTLIFYVDYEQGRPSNVSVAFMKNDILYSFIVLNEKPNELFFIDKNALNDKILVKCDLNANSYLTLETVLTDVHSRTNIVSDISSFGMLFAAYSDKKLIDSATGTEISPKLFEDGEFCLNRNYIVYFE